MFHYLLALLNYCCFLTITVPVLIKCLIELHGTFLALDEVYKSFWTKVLFVKSLIISLYRQWLNGNVKKLSKDRYELSFILNGELCKITVKKNNPQIIDVQNDSDESYMDSLEPYVKFSQEDWPVSKPCTIYYEDGTTRIIN